jgi:AraC-like DNA-binding protein
MDALGHILSSIRLTSPLLAQLRLGNDVTLSMGTRDAPITAAPFHYVERGHCRLITPDGQINLRAGDTVLLSRWPAYRLETGAATHSLSIAEIGAERRLPQWTMGAGLDVSLDVQAGGPPYEAELLGGIFAFDSAGAAFLLKDLPEHIHISADDHGLASILRAALAFIREDEAGKPGYAATAVRLLEVLLIEILRSWALATRHAPGRLSGMSDPLLAPALYGMHTQPGRKWTLAELASLAGRSRSGFASHFAATVGVTPAAYLAEWRCQLGERRLAAYDDSIARIAYDLGYDSSFAFTRMFRRSRGVTPKRFRMQRRGT